jgi:DNA-binding transcriptional regulator LsrR (DeoR family)
MPGHGRRKKGSDEKKAAGKAPRRRVNRNLADDERLMQRAVLETFLRAGQPSFSSMRDVARETGASVPGLSHLLLQAWKRGLFHVHVDLPQEVKDISRLEAAVQARYGLQKVLLITGRPEILGKIDEPQRRALHTGVIREMAVRVVPYLDELLGAATNGTTLQLGVAWGRSMSLIVRQLQTTPRTVRCPSLNVLPLVGPTATLNREPVEANVIAMAIAQCYGGVSEQLPAPAFVPRLDYSLITQRDPIKAMLRRLRDCRIVLTSMGPIPDDGSEITLSKDPALNAALLRSARRDGAIGEICYTLLGRDGEPVESEYRSIGLGYDDLKRIAADKDRTVILVTGGDRRRFECLRAALLARLASVLVSDTVTARYLIDEVQP